MTLEEVAKLLPALLFVALLFRRAFRLSRARSQASASPGMSSPSAPSRVPADRRPVTAGRRNERVVFARDYEPIEPR